MKNFNKFITLKLLTALGFINFSFIIFIIFYMYPNAKMYDITSGEDIAFGMAFLIILCSKYCFYSACGTLILSFLFLAEKFLCNSKKLELHTMSLLGIIFAIIPVAVQIYFFFENCKKI